MTSVWPANTAKLRRSNGVQAGVDYIRRAGTPEPLEYNASANNEILTNIRTQPLKNRNQAIQSSTAIAVLS